jgi:Peptidase family M3
MFYDKRRADLCLSRYMYSLVFAADMYATVFKKDPLDSTLGDQYRRSILVPGGSREEIVSLTVWLGLRLKKFERLMSLPAIGVPWASPKFRCILEGDVWS